MRPLAIIAFALALATPRPASAKELSGEREALLLLRILSYDNALSSRVQKQVTVVVVYRSDDEASGAARQRIMIGLKAAQKLKVGGLPVFVSSHAFTDAATLERTLVAADAAAVYVCPGVSAAEASQATRGSSSLSFSSEPAVRAGLTVAVVAGVKKDRILINTAAAKAEGVRFDAGLLKLAERIGDSP
jgi:hypothetical protein